MSKPVVVTGLVGATAIATGANHTCALSKSAGWCWGFNVQGQLGIGAPSAKEHTPVAIAGLSAPTAIAAGGLHTCALKQDGAPVCWGTNYTGEVGDGTAWATTPAKVVGL